jgi:hypothetical protein
MEDEDDRSEQQDWALAGARRGYLAEQGITHEPRMVTEAPRDPLMDFVGTTLFPWVVTSSLVIAFIVADLVHLDGPRTTFIIGLGGMLTLVGVCAYGWWWLIRIAMKGQVAPAMSKETKLWPGLGPLLRRWGRTCLAIIGWWAMIILTTWAIVGGG